MFADHRIFLGNPENLYQKLLNLGDQGVIKAPAEWVLQGFFRGGIQRGEAVTPILTKSRQNHTFLRIQKQVEFFSLFLRQVIRYLHPDLRVVNAHEKVEKITQVSLVDNAPFV